jgi:hypothetical protein
MLIFVSYARPDRGRIAPIVDSLAVQGFDLWMDFRRLKGGQDWRFEIERAMDRADLVLVFVSKNSVNRRGFVQRELVRALDKSSEKLRDDIYLIPVLLDDDVEVPRHIEHLHHVSANRSDFMAELVDTISHQMQRLGKDRKEVQERGGVSWEKKTIKESWEGYPGFAVELEYFEFSSHLYPRIHEITESVKGRFLLKLFEERGTQFHQMPELFGEDANHFRRTNTYDATCLEPNLLGRILSLQYRVHWYGAGAVHPNMHFETFNFILKPTTIISQFLGMFRDFGAAHALVQSEVRKQLYVIRLPWDDSAAALNRETIDEGTKSTQSWNTFWFTPAGVELLFSPYTVGPYAAGPQFATIPYATLLPHMREEVVSALDDAGSI